MVAIALPPPRQLSFLDTPPAPSTFDVLKLSWWLNRLRYTDALLCGVWRVERQHFQQIADVANDDAPGALDDAKDGTLVTGTYVEYVVWHAGRMIGAVEVRAEDGTKISGLHGRLARYLLVNGWQVDRTRLIEGGALASAGMSLARLPRLLKGE